jgi:hypothetical protein
MAAGYGQQQEAHRCIVKFFEPAGKGKGMGLNRLKANKTG